MNPFQSDNIWKKKARQGKAQQHPLTPQQEWQKQVNSSSLWLGGGVVLLALYLAAVRAGTVALVQLFAGPIVALFDPNPAVVAAGVTYLRICCSVNFAFYAAMYLFDSLATGVGAAGLAMGNAMLHSVVMRLALSWWLGGALGFSGLCWAEMLAPIPSALLGLLWFRLGRWRQRGPL